MGFSGDGYLAHIAFATILGWLVCRWNEGQKSTVVSVFPHFSRRRNAEMTSGK